MTYDKCTKQVLIFQQTFIFSLPIMENTPYQRLELFWKAKGLKNAAAFAESVNGLTAAALSAMKKRGSLPSAPSMRYIQIAYPDISPDYILFEEGGMYKDGHALTALSAVAHKAAESSRASSVATVSNAGGTQVVEHADTVLKLAETEQKLVEAEKQLSGVTAEKDQLSERLKDAKEEILWLRGKSPASSDAANPTALAPLPAPNAIGYHACAKRRAAEFDEYVQVRQEEGGVAELV